MTPEEAYALYRKYILQFLRWTGPGPAENDLPVKEDGKTTFEFCGSNTLADFLNFVLKERE